METKQATADVVNFETPADDSEGSESIDISDEFFIKDLKRLKELRSFLIEQAVCMDALSSHVTSFGRLNRLRYHPKGRMPTEAEWTTVENNTEALFKVLTEPLRRKFILGETPWWVTMAAAGFALFAVFSLLGAICLMEWYNDDRGGTKVLPLYIFWLLSLGAVGATAFIAMNALSLQEDATFDLSNTRLIVLRIALGALFALVLCIPFGFNDFVEFLRYLRDPRAAPQSAAEASRSTLMLLLPFILGFSTSLVIMVLNRFVEAVHTFFGKSSVVVSNAPTAPTRLN